MLTEDSMKLPGFIDLQVNGYSGVDFSDPATTVDQVLQASENLSQNGTAGFLATVTTRPREVMETCLETVASAIKKQGRYGNILGIHLEGPFISPEYGYRGSHPAEAVSPPDLQWFRRFQKLSDGNMRIVTLAPEYESAVDFISAVAREVIVSAGHTNCSFAQACQAVKAGLAMATHIGNGCRQTIDRHNNPIVNLLACSEITLSFIPDGFHLPEAFIRTVISSRPIKKLVVVSDGTRFSGMAPGKYITSAGQEVVLEASGRLSTASDPNVLAGSSSNMFKCMNHLASLGILSAGDLWSVAYLNPLSLLGIDPKKPTSNRMRLNYDPSTRRFELM